MNAHIIALLGLIAATGCGTVNQWTKTGGEKPPPPPPPWARPNWHPDGKLKIAVVDPTQRDPRADVALYQSGDAKPEHTVIAFVSADDEAGQEARIVTMMLDYARHVGASGVALLGPEKPNEKLALAQPLWQPTGRRVFRANIILAK